MKSEEIESLNVEFKKSVSSKLGRELTPADIHAINVFIACSQASFELENY